VDPKYSDFEKTVMGIHSEYEKRINSMRVQLSGTIRKTTTTSRKLKITRSQLKDTKSRERLFAALNDELETELKAKED
jgi:hypothetical protein